MIDPAARARLEGWKQSLFGRAVDLAAGEAALRALSAGPQHIALVGMDAADLAVEVASGTAYALDPDVADPVGHRLRVARPPAELARDLAAMRRLARAALAEEGAHVLWLALGALVWVDHAGAPHAAPLWLVPVELERSDGSGARVVAAAGLVATLNPALGELLRRETELILPEVATFAAALELAEGIAVTRPGWRVERTVHLGVFALDAARIANDIETLGDAVLENLVVAHAVAGGEVAFAQPTSAAAGAVTMQPGAVAGLDLLAPLDADASQLTAVAAGAAGASFVLQGPPGTGKSQTIANLVVHAASSGKTVLLVSKKRAALDVVQQRLASIGLGEICLDVSKLRTRGAVAGALARVLERAFRPGTNLGADGRLADLRGALDGHVTALHRVGAFGQSLHAVLGRLVELRGVARAPLADADTTTLDADTYARRHAAVQALGEAALAVEPVAGHPWRAARLATWTDGDDARALAALDEAAAAGAALADAVREIARLVPGIVARSRDQLRALGALGELAARSPRPGAELLTNLRMARRSEVEQLNEQVALLRARGSGSIEVPRDPQGFLALATRHRQLTAEVRDWFTEAVDSLDAHAAWTALRKWTESVAPVRFVALRAIRAQVKAVAQPGELESDVAMIAALEAAIAERACRAALHAAAEPARRWFGDLGGDPVTLDLAAIDAAVSWASELRRAFEAVDVLGGEPGRAAAWRALVAQVAASSTDGDLVPFTRLAECVERWTPALAALATATGIDRLELGAGDDHLASLREQLETLRHSISSLEAWVAFHAARTAATDAGVHIAVDAIEHGDLAGGELATIWERATLLAWAEAELTSSPTIAGFHGAAHHAHIAAFADLDRANLALERSRALARIAERVPRIPRDRTAVHEALLAELAALKEPTGTIRELFTALPMLLPRLAPCMAMTPGDVALHLPVGARFDVVVFDEASRIAMGEALGALARGGSAVVIGDAGLIGADVPSLLETCTAARLPELRLTSHYGSKHEDLVAFVNHRYYRDQLQVFPAAQPSSELGLAWRRVDGTYDADLGENRAEAESIVAEVLVRLRDPAQRTRSLAIATFSARQRTLIEDLLEDARTDPAIDALFELEAAEPFVIKTVDGLQGETRDVVFLSVAAQPGVGDLGPLWHPGGERHLAVALTRAREQLVLVTSFGPEDVPEQSPVAITDLGRLLDERRRREPRPEQPPASPITAAIARALTDRGWIVRHQVGTGAYRIDLAVVDPNDPDRHVLAIETDGAAYASAPTARDRDRLRPQILAALGWRLHRVWSLDWWSDAEREVQRAHGAIVTALAASRHRRTTTHPGLASTAARPRSRPSNPPASAPHRLSSPVIHIPPKRLTTESGPLFASGSGPNEAAPVGGDTTQPVSRPHSWGKVRRGEIIIGPYTVAAIPAGRRAPDDLFAPRHLPELGKVVEQVLAAEAPMHVELLARRVGAYFGIGRVTQRVTEQVRVALAGRGRWGDEPDIVWRLDQDPATVPAVRVAPSDLGAPSWRDIAEVPLSELAAAVRIVVERAPNIGTSNLVRDTARLLGFTRMTDKVVDRIAVGVQSAAERDLILLEGGRAALP